MVEVFKTDVSERCKADQLIQQIHELFPTYRASFDLEDCDRVLVVKCQHLLIESSVIIDLIKSLNYHAEVLPDEVVK